MTRVKSILGLFLVIGIGFAVGFWSGRGEKNVSRSANSEQVSASSYKVGILQTASHPSLDEIAAGVQQEFASSEATIEIIFLNAQGNQNTMNTMATDLVNQQCDLLVGVATQACQALANNTTEIPIIMAGVADPVGADLVANELASDRNITGVKNQAPIEAQLQFAQEVLPERKNLGILYTSSEANALAEATRAQTVAQALGYTVQTYAITDSNDIQAMVSKIGQEQDLLYLPTDNTLANAMETIVMTANLAQLPVIPTVEAMIAQGGLLTVSIDQFAMGTTAAQMGLEILVGQKTPQNLPVRVLNEGTRLMNRTQAKNLHVADTWLQDETITFLD